MPADLLAGGALAEQPWTPDGLVLQRGAAVSLVREDGTATSLGPGSVAAADPTGPGAVVATGGRALPPHDVLPPSSTAARVELRRVGAPPVVLVTAERFARAVGLPAAPVVVDRLAVSPDGTRVLVSGWTASQRESPSHGLLVVDRRGQQVAVVRARPRTSGNWAVWAPSGAGLALGTFAETATLFDPDRLVELWDLRTDPVAVDLPGALRGAAQEPCVWAPDSTRLLCGDGRGWFAVDATARTATAVAGGTGRPVAWLP